MLPVRSAWDGSQRSALAARTPPVELEFVLPMRAERAAPCEPPGAGRRHRIWRPWEPSPNLSLVKLDAPMGNRPGGRVTPMAVPPASTRDLMRRRIGSDRRWSVLPPQACQMAARREAAYWRSMAQARPRPGQCGRAAMPWDGRRPRCASGRRSPSTGARFPTAPHRRCRQQGRRRDRHSLSAAVRQRNPARVSASVH